jgi:hypothetical protein
MKLKEYLATAQAQGDIVAFTYSFNGDQNNDSDIEDFSIGPRILRLENLAFRMDTEGEVVESGEFMFNCEGDTIGIEPLY